MSLFQAAVSGSPAASFDTPRANLPDMTRYSMTRPMGFAGRQTTQAILSKSARVFEPGQPIQFDIAATNGFLDPRSTFLKFTVKVTYPSVNGVDAASAKNKARVQQMWLDTSAHSCIEQLRIISQAGDELELIDGYGRLVNALSSVQVSKDERKLASLQIQGYDSPIFERDHTVVVANTVAQKVVAKTFCIPLYGSGILGPNAHKFWPLCLSPLILEMRLSNDFMIGISDAQAVAVGGVGNTGARMSWVTVEQPTLYASVAQYDDIQIPNTLKSLVLQQNTPLFMTTTSWRKVPAQEFSNAGPYSVPINDKLRSVRSIFGTASKKNPGLEKRTYESINAKLTNFQLLVGAAYMPNQPMRDDQEVIVETLRSLNEYPSLLHSAGCDLASWKREDSSTGAAVGVDADAVSILSEDVNGFTVGLDLEAVHGSNGLINGQNFIENQPVTFSFESGTTVPNGAYMHLYLNYDLIISFSIDGRTVRIA
jgi:hypothetical protein